MNGIIIGNFNPITLSDIEKVKKERKKHKLDVVYFMLKDDGKQNFIDLKSHELKSYTKKICSECWQKETLIEEETGFCIEKNDLLRLRRKHLLPHISERTFLRTKKE